MLVRHSTLALAAGAALTFSAGATAQVANVITDPNPQSLAGRGVFGGLVIDGFAAVNNANATGEASSEVDRDLTDGFRFFGGRQDTDNSGSIRYLVIAESGVTFRPDEEIQGLTLEGVGSGTRIGFVQVIGSEDDGVEWFGGRVDADHLVINGADDDSLDMDLGYRGFVQYALVTQGAANGNYGIESDGNGDDFEATPFTAPRLANLTILGDQGRSDETTTGALHREGYRGQVHRSVYANTGAAPAGFEDGCLDIDELAPPTLLYRDAIFSCPPGSGLAEADEDPSLQQTAVGSGQVEFSARTDIPGLSIDRTTYAVDTGAVTPDSPLPGGFATNTYFGAVDPGDTTPWWRGWTAQLAAGDGSLLARNVHPLANDIGGDITASATNGCRGIDADFSNGGEVEIFDETFPVCVIGETDLSNQTGGAGQREIVNLTNDHVYVLDGFVEVGDGGGAGATAATAQNVTLNLEGGVQIFGATETDGSLVITRGSNINVRGTPQLPIVMSGVATSL